MAVADVWAGEAGICAQQKAANGSAVLLLMCSASAACSPLSGGEQSPGAEHTATCASVCLIPTARPRGAPLECLEECKEALKPLFGGR